ncbi:DegT/DnrJ/EryC1/StrS family aminotransferase [Flavobacterium laiguense]|uniref:Aminotransferase DegT n=1 Tax=Flavobacterium laiguense TaxID=2169409 RepID=A0A2U1JY73_9FLAO|nr:DegT/DnrJ/EryC1/StrS family aminotransferase [Flavobacterium laiguense]PWA09909.1 aminotransferase DegT [Flavobacterium laiguense]
MSKNNFIPVNTPLLDGNELKYVTECITTGWISSEGPFVDKFESALAQYTDRRHGIAVANGTAALDIAFSAIGLKKGDEVILPSHTIISCILQIIRIGAIPILVDSELKTWNMDVDEIESKITSKTKAILAVHLYGLPCRIDKIIEIADKHNLYVIEDAAQMIGQTFNGKPCGSFGHISTTSFYPNKQVTTGEGGMCLTNDDDLANKCRSFRNLCFQTESRFVHKELGWNYRMTNIQAALGLAQVEKLDEHVVLKRKIGNKYSELLKDISGFNLPLMETEYAKNIYWVYGIFLNENSKYNAKEAMLLLQEAGIATRPFYYPMHLQPVFQEDKLFEGQEYPNAEILYNRAFYIPSGVGFTENDVEAVSKVLIDLFKV